MALNQAGRSSPCSPRVLKSVLGLMAISLVAYILGPPLYWHLMEGLAAVSRSSSVTTCPPCNCDCNSEPFFFIPPGLSNVSLADCAKRDPEVGEDTEKNFADLLSEELKLREAEASENQRKADMALLEAKKLTSQYMKEADKCNSGMETCEEAREKAEVLLLAQKKMTATWEMRACQKGWKEGAAKSRSQSQGNVQTM
ncbi:uncharacterized protein LOC125876582 [Solanum stenotomum]|uniref:uncharacterized protein LOC125876582 n=1 Tax=Solanum stenotomum TaxID=172797 RepID=UPI0020D12476|nr:uncharacterized protein LOC125876582 [Solanum stenotomum]